MIKSKNHKNVESITTLQNLTINVISWMIWKTQTCCFVG